MTAEDSFEVVVVGGGVVGAALARALRGASVALVAEPPAGPPAQTEKFDARVYAISPGNVAFLSQLGAWQQLAPERLTPVHAMRVYGDDGDSLIEFDAYAAGASELAWIVEDARLQDALWRGLETWRMKATQASTRMVCSTPNAPEMP